MTHADLRASPGPTMGTWLGLAVYVAVTLVLMFWPAGTIDWRRGWLFITLFVILMFIAVGWIARDNPELFVARSKIQKGAKGWDVILSSIVVVLILAVVPVAALDDARFHWAPTPDWVPLLGYALLIAGFMGVTWAQSVNRHFEAAVRIQTERDHRVIETGPYAYIRHPGYAFAILMSAGIALSLGSLVALILVALVTVLLAIRTVGEDAVLREGLPGYADYAARVKYRWLPFVW